MIQEQKMALSDINFKPIVKAHLYQTAPRFVAEFRWTHSLRVMGLSKKLAEGKPVDINKVAIIGLIHDMFKYLESSKNMHGDLAAKYLDNIVSSYNFDEKESREWELAIEAILHHSEKVNIENNLYLAILSDVDVLDKIQIGYVSRYYKYFSSPDIDIHDVVNKLKAKTTKYTGMTKEYEIFRKRITKRLDNTDFSKYIFRNDSGTIVF